MSKSTKEQAELTKCVTKALSPQEKPLELKHVAAILKSTHSMHDAQLIWSVARRQNLMSNRITAWKFCSLLHRLLRHGHRQVIADSLGQHQQLEFMCNYWAQLQDPMAHSIALYCRALLNKLQFHATYTFFNGCLEVVGEQNWNVNTGFQLCMDIYDLLEDLVSVQQSVFANLEIKLISTTSTAAQVRLLPLISVIDESDNLYQQAIAVLHILYSELPADDVAGLRDRFYEVYAKLQRFYGHLRNVEFMAELLPVPAYAAIPPNFYRQTYFDEMPAATPAQAAWTAWAAPTTPLTPGTPSAPLECELDF